jgi:hypothetical protein
MGCHQRKLQANCAGGPRDRQWDRNLQVGNIAGSGRRSPEVAPYFILSARLTAQTAPYHGSCIALPESDLPKLGAFWRSLFFLFR